MKHTRALPTPSMSDNSMGSLSRSGSSEPAPQSRRSSSPTHTIISLMSPPRSKDSPPPRKKLRRLYELTTFGHIPGIRVGATWMTRLECSRYGVHAPPLAGVHGHKDKGCFSVVMSGAYEDDEDNGDWFTYTGTGGRTESHNRGKLCEHLSQTFDQTYEHPHNASLLQSYVSKNPVRVVRGHNTTYGPRTGYRYDGLYIVENASYDTGKNKHQICTFTFRRMAGQDPLPTK